MHLYPLETVHHHRGTVVVPDGASVRVLDAALEQIAMAAGMRTWQGPEVVAWPG